jgi:hypothetical protein
VELNVTGNTGWDAAQLSEFEIFPNGVVLARQYRMISSSWAGAASSRSIPFERSVMTRTSSPLQEEGVKSVMSA